MNHTITVTGIIMAQTPMGEFDKRIVLLTKERGKISAFAKGARKPNSPLIGATNTFSFGRFQLFEGRTSYTVHSAVIDNYFAELRDDVEAAYYGFYFMDIANYYTREANDETQMMKLIYQTLRALAKKSIPNPLIRCIYELKTMVINGEGPQVFQCMKCGKETGDFIFSTAKGGIICADCKWEVADGMPLSGSTLYTLQYITSSTIEKLYTFLVTEEVQEELENLTERYLSVYMGKNFKSLEILETLISM